MKILAFETTGPYASVAYLEPETNTADERVATGEFTHLKSTLPLAEDLLNANGVRLADVTHIAVSRGPGSFTGIRIGMTVARTLGQVLNVPVIPVPTLESFLYFAPDEETLVCPLFDAKRSQIYAAAYRMEGGQRVTEVPECAFDIGDYMDLVQIPLHNHKIETGRPMTPLFFGDGIEPYKRQIGERLLSWCDADLIPDGFQAFAPEEFRYQRALAVAYLGWMMANEGKAVPWNEAEPVYLRKAEAERKLDAEREEKLHAALDVFTK
ncbi:MAG: tRNA (adenosine(37)-N6)-threonylcarbamoyltransferase complex dimerization subunit type 1 TsaB [Firmicutes bacterium]|nr:tRNA (adenosine(37)-N6)-threonylcarbamoyltransferase complex dimerization subunit type 1 TsaB [Bacillota bacterium]